MGRVNVRMGEIVNRLNVTLNVTSLSLAEHSAELSSKIQLFRRRHPNTTAGYPQMALVRLRESRGGRHGKLRATTDPTYGSRIQAAKDGIVAGRYESISAAARDQM